MQGKPAETRRQTHTCRSGFLDWSRSQRTDDWCANLHPFRIGEFFEDGFKPRIRFTNAVRILNNRFAVGKETRNSKGHRDAMIAEAHYARPMQGSRTMNFEAIFHFGDLCTHGAQIVRDCGNAIAFLDAQLLRMANDCCAICQGACYCQYRQFVNELRHFFALNDGTFECDSCDLDDSARLKLIDIFDGFSPARPFAATRRVTPFGYRLNQY